MLPQDYIPGGKPGSPLVIPQVDAASQSMTLISADDLNSDPSGPQEPRVYLGVCLLGIRCSVRTQIISC